MNDDLASNDLASNDLARNKGASSGQALDEHQAAGPALTGRDVVAALLWLALPVGFVLAIEAWGLPYEPLAGAPETDSSYAIVIYGLISAGGVLGSLSNFGRLLLPGRLFSAEDMRALVLKLLRKPLEPWPLARPPRYFAAGTIVLLGIAVVIAGLIFGAAGFVPALAVLSLVLVFCLGLFAATAQRAQRRGEDPRLWWLVHDDEPVGLDALASISEGMGKRWSIFVWKRALPLFLVVVAGATLFDQATKVWAQQKFAVVDQRRSTVRVGGEVKRVPVRKFFNNPKAEMHIIPQALSFKYAENPAAAFSLTGNLPYWVRRPFLVGVSTLAVLFIGMWFFLQRRPDGLLMFAFALIIGGALGNLVDRIRFGYVIDFINAYAGFINPRYIWPTFNIADSAIVGGALTVVFRTFRPLYPEPELRSDDEGHPVGKSDSKGKGKGKDDDVSTDPNTNPAQGGT